MHSAIAPFSSLNYLHGINNDSNFASLISSLSLNNEITISSVMHLRVRYSLYGDRTVTCRGRITPVFNFFAQVRASKLMNY